MGIVFRELQQLQHCNSFWVKTNQEKQISEKKWKISCEVFVNRNERLLPLQRQIEIADRWSLRVKIARVKSGNCAH